MDEFPCGPFDLIHVDGQQDGDGSWHDLQLAIKQARWILVDGYFWTSQNFLSISSFLHHHRSAIRFYSVIPGYAGELLIQVWPEYLDQCESIEGRPARALRDIFTNSYFLHECSGFEEYNKNFGKYLEDERLQVVAALANTTMPRRVLDLGCGRGELAHFLAEAGAEVTAADFSEAAIRLTEKTFEGEPNLREQLDLIHADVCDMPLTGTFDSVIASDLIQHVRPEELDLLYARVSEHLAPNGIFVVHAYPNLWYYRYDYVRKRRIAESVGSYLPPEPRTCREMIIHINEQSPRVIRRSLQRHFENVALWFGEPGQPIRSLLEKMSHRDLAAARDVYAVASHSPIDLQRLRRLFVSYPIPPEELHGIELKIWAIPAAVEPGAVFTVLIEVVNDSLATLNSNQPNPVHFSYHWMSAGRHGTIVFDGDRTPIMPALEPGTRRRFPVRVQAPERTGDLVLRFTLVQELVRWFDTAPLNLALDTAVEVRSQQESELRFLSKP
jgi:SAM-dependent methyltransferase